MTSDQRLTSKQLCWRCPVEELGFQATDELDIQDEVLGQSRALESIKFGIGMRHEGYNLFVLGPPGVGKRTRCGSNAEALLKSVQQWRPRLLLLDRSGQFVSESTFTTLVTQLPCPLVVVTAMREQRSRSNFTLVPSPRWPAGERVG